jgi:hypothetical protein
MMAMSPWLQWTFYAIVAVMVVSWVIAARCFVIVSLELRRARQAGEANYIPRAARGLPLVAIFTKDALPRVEKERRKLVYALAVFLGGWLAMPLLSAMFGH